MKVAPAARPELSESELRSWHLLGEFRAALEKVTPGPQRGRPPGGPRRLLSEDDYLSALLFAQFNPVLSSCRGLCAASHLEKVQQQVCSRPVSLGSFSEAQSVFGFGRLEKVFENLVGEKLRRSAGAPGNRTAVLQARRLTLVDSSVFPALVRMQWAEWRTQGKDQSAVRLHTKLNLFENIPTGVRVTGPRVCERKAFAAMVTPGEFYVGDCYYGGDYGLFGSLEEAGCGFITRLRANAALTVLEELEPGAADRAAGVVSDRVVRLGSRGCWHHGPVRVVRIEKPGLDAPLLLVTNRLDPGSFSAALVAEIYRQRWAIELFFRWFKCVLGRAGQWHWFAESPDGVAIQLYCGLIAALLLSVHLGRLPNKRTMEMLQFHAAGLASAQELEALLGASLQRKRR